MHRLRNTTPFPAGIDIFPDLGGIDTLYVTLKATFTLGPALAVAELQPKIHSVDEYTGEPGRSSLRHPGERHLACPGTAIIVLGSAHAPRPVSTLDVSLAVADVRKTVRVHGDRRWQRGSASAPVPFTTMPLTHERALGGPDDPRNPVGVGLRGDRDPGAQIGEPLPNLEDPRRPCLEHGDRSPPACFAPIAPHWSPRRELAGTLDEAWRRHRAPYMPVDCDPRHFHAAPPDQISREALRGGEALELYNASLEPLRLALPTCAWTVTATIAGVDHPLAPQLETVRLEPDAGRLGMLWRAALGVDRRALQIDEVRVDLRELRT